MVFFLTCQNNHANTMVFFSAFFYKTKSDIYAQLYCYDTSSNNTMEHYK